MSSIRQSWVVSLSPVHTYSSKWVRRRRQPKWWRKNDEDGILFVSLPPPVRVCRRWVTVLRWMEDLVWMGRSHHVVVVVVVVVWVWFVWNLCRNESSSSLSLSSKMLLLYYHHPSIQSSSKWDQSTTRSPSSYHEYILILLVNQPPVVVVVVWMDLVRWKSTETFSPSPPQWQHTRRTKQTNKQTKDPYVHTHSCFFLPFFFYLFQTTTMNFELKNCLVRWLFTFWRDDKTFFLSHSTTREG